jgi:hypothetical protein
MSESRSNNMSTRPRGEPRFPSPDPGKGSERNLMTYKREGLMGFGYRLTPTYVLSRGAVALLLLLPLSGVLPLAAASPASATTLSVCAYGCPYTQIGPAVAAAQDGGTVLIGPGTYSGGITIEASVDLVGAGRGRTIINGGGPVVTIGSTTSTPTVTIANLTITGGLSTTDPRAPLCGPDMPICGPGYTTVTALGGGIEAFPGTKVAVVDSAITANTAVASGTVPSARATCQGDIACPFSQGAGGGIDDWGTMTLIGTAVTHNEANGVQVDGGGIAVGIGASLSLQSSSVTASSAVSPGPYGRFTNGGGIFVDNGATLVIDATVIDGNAASLSNSIPDPYPLSGGSPDQNNAYTGGVFLAGAATATIRGSELDGNSTTVDTPLGQAYGADAALCACGGGALTLPNVRIDDNEVTVNTLSSDTNGASGPGALEADGSATIANVEIVSNRVSIYSATSDAAVVGAIGFFPSGTVSPTITNGLIANNTSTANAPSGAATVQGAGLTNDAPLALTNVLIQANKAVANGKTGHAQGGGVWNGSIFGGPTPSLSLNDSRIVGNTLSGSPGTALQGAGIFTLGSPVNLGNSVVAHNVPDQCYGC